MISLALQNNLNRRLGGGGDFNLRPTCYEIECNRHFQSYILRPTCHGIECNRHFQSYKIKVTLSMKKHMKERTGTYVCLKIDKNGNFIV